MQAVVDELKRMILTGQLPVGTALPPELELCRVFGVSRAALREAAHILEQTGLVTRNANARRRLTVAPIDDRTARAALADLIEHQHISFDEVFEVLAFTEPQVARWAAERATDEERGAIRATLAELDAAASEPGRIGELHTRLHEQIAAASKNRLLVLIWRSIDVALNPMRERLITGPASIAGLVKLHRPLVDAILNGDVEQAALMSQRHLHTFQRAYAALEAEPSATTDDHRRQPRSSEQASRDTTATTTARPHHKEELG